MSDRDYYEILGLTPQADGQMVDQAYWHLVRKYQALAETNSRAQRMIDELNEAYGVLGNPKLREQYDAFRDDVLIRAGMIQPVKSKPKRERARKDAGQPRPRRSVRIPVVRIQHWRTYAVAGVIGTLAFAGAWQGVNIALVALLLTTGLAVSLAPTLGKHVFDLELPSVSMPEVRAPKLGELHLPVRDASSEGVDAETLRESTAATIARWRRTVGLRAPTSDQNDVEGGDDVRTESTENEAPLQAVMEILRGSAKVAR